MVINSAQMQNAGKEFMLFQAVSVKQETQVGKDSFSAIFNNVTGRNNIFESKRPEMKVADYNDNKPVFADKKFTKNQIDKDSEFVRDIFTEKADVTKNVKENVETEDETSESFIEKAASFLFQITVTVTVVLNVSMDELKAGMQELSLKPVDLLDANKRYDLFVNLAASGDAANLLKDNSLVDVLNTMENQIADLFATEGITAESFEETFRLTVETVAEKANEIMERFMTAAGANEAPKTDDVKSDAKDTDTVVIDGIINDKMPKVEVSTESQSDSTGKNNTESSKKEKQQPIKTEEVSAKFVNHLVNSFEARFQQIKVTEVQAMPDLREIVNQIMEQVKIHVNNANTSIEIQLTPESLGKVQVSVEDNNGVLTAKFQAESRVAKEAIESNLIQFKEHLAEQGIKVDSVEVSVGNFDFTGNQFGKGQGQDAESHVKKHFSMEDTGIATDTSKDLKEAAYIENGTSTVSFTA